MVPPNKTLITDKKIIRSAGAAASAQEPTPRLADSEDKKRIREKLLKPKLKGVPGGLSAADKQRRVREQRAALLGQKVG